MSLPAGSTRRAQQLTRGVSAAQASSTESYAFTTFTGDIRPACQSSEGDLRCRARSGDKESCDSDDVFFFPPCIPFTRVTRSLLTWDHGRKVVDSTIWDSLQLALAQGLERGWTAQSFYSRPPGVKFDSQCGFVARACKWSCSAGSRHSRSWSGPSSESRCTNLAPTGTASDTSTPPAGLKRSDAPACNSVLRLPPSSRHSGT